MKRRSTLASSVLSDATNLPMYNNNGKNYVNSRLSLAPGKSSRKSNINSLTDSMAAVGISKKRESNFGYNLLFHDKVNGRRSLDLRFLQRIHGQFAKSLGSRMQFVH